MQKDVEKKKEDRADKQIKRTNNIVQKTFRRFMKNRFDQWKAKCGDEQAKEGGANKIIQRLRKRFLRKAFDQYRLKLKEIDAENFVKDRTKYFINMTSNRRAGLCFQAWKDHIHKHVTAKKYWIRLYSYCDSEMQRKAFDKWNKYRSLHRENSLTVQQNNLIEENDNMSKEIHQHQNVIQAQNEDNKSLKDDLTKQSRRIIGNKFARLFFASQAQAFSKWKENMEYQKRCEKLMKNALLKMQRSSKGQLKRAWDQMCKRQQINEHKEKLQQKEFDGGEIELHGQIQSEQMETAIKAQQEHQEDMA